jgi:hypothetical protein
LASHPGLAIVTIMCTQSGPGTASEVATWASNYGLTNVKVWADTTDYMYTNFTSQPAIGGGYPSTIVIDLDTMTIKYFALTGIESTTSVIDAIYAAADPCADL